MLYRWRRYRCQSPISKYMLYGKGYALINLAKYEEAIEYLDKALAIDPNYIDALYLRKMVEEKLQNKKTLREYKKSPI